MAKAPQPETPTQGFPTRSTTPPEVVQGFAVEAARLLADDKCEDVVLLDVRELSQVADFIVIGSGTSDRQMKSVLTHVQELGGKMGFPSYRASTDDRATWLLADFVDVVVHVFEPNTRAHYDLEMLWGDAQRLEWQREEGAPRPGARHP
jgi:ribosome-associated protein